MNKSDTPCHDFANSIDIRIVYCIIIEWLWWWLWRWLWLSQGRWLHFFSQKKKKRKTFINEWTMHNEYANVIKLTTRNKMKWNKMAKEQQCTPSDDWSSFKVCNHFYLMFFFFIVLFSILAHFGTLKYRNIEQKVIWCVCLYF